MIIAEYTLDHPLLRQTLHAIPGLEITWEDAITDQEGLMRLIAWVEIDDYDAFNAAVDEDPTVANPTVLTESGGRRLYRIDYIGAGREDSTLPILVEVGGVIQQSVGTNSGWRIRTRFPDRGALGELHQFCRDNDIGFTFHRVFERSEMFGPTALQLSEAQHETLIEAVESGYLDIPRQTSLAELGDRMGISESAASERFRRAVKKLVQQTLFT